MFSLTCFVIDDLPEAVDTLSIYISQTPELTLLGSSNSAIPFLQDLRNGLRPDILFLDIEMPDIDGMELSRQLRNQCHIIFVTGHAEYGAEAFDVDCVDFLRKPISYARFYQAVNKAIRLIRAEEVQHPQQPVSSNTSGTRLAESKPAYMSKSTLEGPSGPGKEDIYAVPSELQGTTEFLKISEILFIEISDGYITIHSTNQRKNIERRSLSSVEKILPDCFLRVERRFIINLNFLRASSGRNIYLHGYLKGIPIGKTYWERVDGYLRRFHKAEG